MRRWGSTAVLVATALFAMRVHAEEDEGDLGELTLEELLELELDVAARTARTIRESPGVLTLITREEIVASGARDLTDVLARVPGIAFGLDVTSIEGIGFRGVWGHEGKVLLLVDGQEMNENLYSTTQWGHHVPAEQVERIEIVRGPGSVVYGGYAELAVINVVTRRGGDLKGGDVSLSYGQLEKDYARRNVSLAWGQKLENGMEVSVAGSFGQGRRSEETFTDFYGTSFDMRTDSRLETSFASLGFAWKGMSLRYIYDDYRMKLRDGYDAVYADTYDQTFGSHLAELKYVAKAGPLTITPKANFRRQTPWHTPQKANDAPFYDKTVDRLSGGLTAQFKALDGFDFLAGAEAYQDHAFLNDDELVGFQSEFSNGETEISYTNVAGFAQAIWDAPFASLAAGARYENHSQFGDSFVPRASLTKIVDRFHVKLLYSNAFRAPGIENLRLNEEIEPERTTVYEAEAGYRVSTTALVTANVFDITLKDPIVYFYDVDTDEEAYVNYPQTGSRGAEVELKIFAGRRHATASVSFYDAAGKNEVDLYEVPGSRSALLGLPQFKFVTSGGTPLAEHVSLEGSFILLGPRHGFLEGDGAGNSEVDEADPVHLVDVFVRWEDALLKGLDVGVGVYNVFDSQYDLIQPYGGGHAPLPSHAREVFARATYGF